MKFFDFKLTVNSCQASEYWGAWSHTSALLNKKEGQCESSEIGKIKPIAAFMPAGGQLTQCDHQPLWKISSYTEQVHYWSTHTHTNGGYTC